MDVAAVAVADVGAPVAPRSRVRAPLEPLDVACLVSHPAGPLGPRVRAAVGRAGLSLGLDGMPALTMVKTEELDVLVPAEPHRAPRPATVLRPVVPPVTAVPVRATAAALEEVGATLADVAEPHEVPRAVGASSLGVGEPCEVAGVLPLVERQPVGLAEGAAVRPLLAAIGAGATYGVVVLLDRVADVPRLDAGGFGALTGRRRPEGDDVAAAPLGAPPCVLGDAEGGRGTGALPLSAVAEVLDGPIRGLAWYFFLAKKLRDDC